MIAKFIKNVKKTVKKGKEYVMNKKRVAYSQILERQKRRNRHKSKKKKLVLVQDK
jgi:hypothetical protein